MKLILLGIALVCANLSAAQNFNGKVIDQDTKRVIQYASVYLTEYQMGVICDHNGRFSFSLDLPEQVMIHVTAADYEGIHQKVNTSDTAIIELNQTHIEIEEMVVSAARGVLQKDNAMYIETRKISELNAIPDRMAGLLSSIPGVYQSSGGSGVSKPVIRGMQGTRVVTSWNGLRIENQQWGGDHGMAIGTLGIGSVEVMKGPASLIYGADALGGVVYFSDKSFVREGSQRLEIESGGESATLGTISGLDYRVSFKNVRLSASGSYSNYADYQLPNGNYLENSRFNEGAGKFSLAWNKRKWLSQINYMYIKSRVGIPGEHEHEEEEEEGEEEDHAAELEVSEQLRSTSFPAQTIENHLLSIKNKWLIKRHVVDLLLGQTINQLKELETSDEVAFNTLLSNSLYHLKWEYEIGGGFNMVSGIQGGIQFNRNGEADDEPLIPDFNQLDNGVYSVFYWKRDRNEKWRVQAGLRYDIRALEAFESELAGTFKRNYQNLNGSVGLVWGIGPFLLRGNVSTGFRSPHVSELTAIGAHHGALRYEIGNPNLISERATQFDGIFEYSTDHLEFVFNPFFNYIQNFIYANPIDSMIDDLPVFQYDQLSGVYLYGADIGIHYHPHFAHWLHWESTYSHIVGEGKNGIDLPLMPQNRLATSLKFTLKNVLKGKFRFENLVVKHSAFFEQNRVSGDELPSNLYQLIDLGLNMKLKVKHPLEFGFGVRNLLNEGYIDHLSRLKNIGVQQTGRNVYFRVKFTFNQQFKKANGFDVLEEIDVVI